MINKKTVINSNEMECPYCHGTWHREGEDYTPDGDVRVIECDMCEQRFWGGEVYEVEHVSTPDCKLNNREHEFSVGLCKVCGRFDRR